ncbi:hypothetical protein P879_11835 [Paragonimus westermani]|uniref:Uncharacterized protein n=1 Tax=Paragonimus westermani TaxID=34504 RepID=A0A8T0DCS9_9TREM|nr:hypothetical protein P879_11835 [Paragonimus westermani]
MGLVFYKLVPRHGLSNELLQTLTNNRRYYEDIHFNTLDQFITACNLLIHYKICLAPVVFSIFPKIMNYAACVLKTR